MWGFKSSSRSKSYNFIILAEDKRSPAFLFLSRAFGGWGSLPADAVSQEILLPQQKENTIT
ncbi:MAG: hypothetical protein A2Y94_15470 [Caldithrix sp. RBG_13_44_9]|nr:MAG: hypothetical protein A2Y94_15470 [Caldithrix sp. RBG_13_44_9]